MGGLHHSVAIAFGESGTIREKGYYKTTDGKRVIRKTKDGHRHILALHEIKRHCKEAGYPWMDQNYLAKNGQPYALIDSEHYVMTDLIHYREADFADPMEFLKVVEATAYWHKAARNIKFSKEAALYDSAGPLTEIIQEQKEHFENIRKRIRKQSKMSDFDVVFLKHYPEYQERITKAQKLLEGTGYLKLFSEAKRKNHICHNNLKEDCLRVYGDWVYITRLEQATVDYQLTDLSNLIHRREKEHKDLKRSEIVEAYNKVLPLERDDEVILEAMLLYPSAFIKIVNEYYQKKRSWTPASMMNKLREALKTARQGEEIT